MNGQITIGDRLKNQYGDIFQRVEGKVGHNDAYVRVTNGKLSSRKIAVHKSFKLELV
jgi:hypothetical protein